MRPQPFQAITAVADQSVNPWRIARVAGSRQCRPNCA